MVEIRGLNERQRRLSQEGDPVSPLSTAAAAFHRGVGRKRSKDGIRQKPIEGTSFLYTFEAKNASVPSRHKTQYFEMFGQ